MPAEEPTVKRDCIQQQIHYDTTGKRCTISIMLHNEGKGDVYSVEANPRWCGFLPIPRTGSSDDAKRLVRKLLHDNGHTCTTRCSPWETPPQMQ